MKKLLLLLFVCSNSFSQTINFKGKLLDKETNKPVVYANVSFLKSNIGISSLEDGTFNLEIDRKLLKEQLHISCLNYKDTVVLASSLQNKTLFLQPKSFELDEVAFSRKIDGKVKVDVSEYDIELPREGLFIGLERLHIPYNFYEYNYTKEGSRKKYVSKSLAPSFGATYTNDSIHIYSKGKWNDFYIPQKIYEGYQIQPAISLTLSN